MEKYIRSQRTFSNSGQGVKKCLLRNSFKIIAKFGRRNVKKWAIYNDVLKMGILKVTSFNNISISKTF